MNVHNQVLLAKACHHRSDAVSSIIALLSIWGATQTFQPTLNLLGGLLVAGMIGATGLQMGLASLKQLTNTQDVELIDRVANAVNDAVDR